MCSACESDDRRWRVAILWRPYRASGTAATCHRAFRLADLVGVRRSRAMGADTKERTARAG
jgi:hypothetical protein